jgi:hypothetical protein
VAQYTQKDSKPLVESLKTQVNSHASTTDGADSGAVDSLAAFIVTLSPEQRAALLSLLNEADN